MDELKGGFMKASASVLQSSGAKLQEGIGVIVIDRNFWGEPTQTNLRFRESPSGKMIVQAIIRLEYNERQWNMPWPTGAPKDKPFEFILYPKTAPFELGVGPNQKGERWAWEISNGDHKDYDQVGMTVQHAAKDVNFFHGVCEIFYRL
jgi:hypothetical protein